MKHPNATIGGGAGAGGGALVLLILGLFGIHADAYVAGLIFVGASSLVLFIGRNGFEGLMRMLIHGDKEPLETPSKLQPPTKPSKPG